MLSPLRNRFGIPGVISVIALVFAMLGGAYAASNSGGGKATASAKGKPGPRGPRGKTGPAGPAGPVGPAGAQGPAGANGKDGANGANGKDGTPGAAGAPGKSVTVAAANEVDECPDLGGAMVKVEGAGSGVEVCNGEEGKEGKEGSPWTAGGTLPPGATATGAWAVTNTFVNAQPNEKTEDPNDEVEQAVTALSFPLKLSFKPKAENIHYVDNALEQDPACTGANSEFPEALPGHLCVYRASASNVTLESIRGLSGFDVGPNTAASRQGALLFFEMSGIGYAVGSYAVTGCSTELPEGDPNKCP